MKTNEYGVPLDRNGYAPSIMPHGSGCALCGMEGVLQRHEIFHGTALREKSKEFGLWIEVCPDCHYEIHNNGRLNRSLKINAERQALKQYKWTIDDFRLRFGKNFLEVDDG